MEIKTDVLVIGAGLAGITAAISAAKAGVQVALASYGAVCSGSSFYPGTWGFGLVGPEDEKDIPDMVETILRVGENAVDRDLAETLVRGANPGIRFLRELGVPLLEAEHKEEREFIPCFDHKGRSWHGIVKEEAGPVFLRQLEESGVASYPGVAVTELLQEADGRVRGAAGVRLEGDAGLVRFSCGAVIIATGGLGGLYQYRLNPADVTGMGQYLALQAGAELVNIEFLQMMPGFLSPAYGTVFNEKVFRFACSDAFGKWDGAERERLLGLRSAHGPYTCRLESGKVDEALMEAWEKEPEGVLVYYSPQVKENQPEFVKTYFDWLWREKGLTPDDPVRLGIFAHASNGGIRIDCRCRTGVAGLYACGEASGGMHGADRLGGLSTANGLVFGRIAGTEAAAEAKVRRGGANWMGQEGQEKGQCLWMPGGKPGGAAKARQELHSRMSRCVMVRRNQKLCQKTLDWLETQTVKWNGEIPVLANPVEYLEWHRLKAELLTARCLVTAVLTREESRGSHHRDDFPERNPSMGRMIAISCLRGEIKGRWI